MLLIIFIVSFYIILKYGSNSQIYWHIWTWNTFKTAGMKINLFFLGLVRSLLQFSTYRFRSLLHTSTYRLCYYIFVYLNICYYTYFCISKYVVLKIKHTYFYLSFLIAHKLGALWLNKPMYPIFLWLPERRVFDLNGLYMSFMSQTKKILNFISCVGCFM